MHRLRKSEINFMPLWNLYFLRNRKRSILKLKKKKDLKSSLYLCKTMLSFQNYYIHFLF